MLPRLKHHKSSTINQDIKYLETIASTPSSPSPPTYQQQAYLNWSLNLDNLVADELGRRLFIEYLKETENESLFNIYIIFLCLPQSEKEDQIKQMLKCTYNSYFKNGKSPIKKKLIKFLSNESLIENLCKSLEQKSYDELLIKNVTQELKKSLEKTFYSKFIRSTFFHSLIDIIRINETTIFLNNLTLDEQVKFIIDYGKSKGLERFLKPNIPDQQQQQQQQGTIKSKSKSKLLNESSSSSSKKSLDLNNKQHQQKRQLIPPNPYHSSTNTAILVSAQDSEIQSLSSDVGQPEDEEAAAGIKLKKNNNKKNDALNSSTVTCVSLKSLHKINNLSSLNNKYEKSYKEMREEAKLNENVEHNMPYIQEITAQIENHKTVNNHKKQPPIAESDPTKFAQILSEKLEKILSINEPKFVVDSDEIFIPKQQDSDIEAERMIDEHVNRVFKQTAIPSSPLSSLKQQQQNNKKIKNSSFIADLVGGGGALNNTCGSYLNPSTPTTQTTQLMSTSKSFLNKTNYQLMASQCKEVDIDQQQQQHHHHHHQQQQYRSSNYHHHDQNYDSGISTRSVASIERVSDWLATSNCNNYQATATTAPIINHVKTTVAYYLPGEDVAYISSFNGTMVTLAQFKQLITKKGHFRYFFKTKSDLLDEECIVYQEVTDESSIVPMFNNKVIAKIEKSSQ